MNINQKSIAVLSSPYLFAISQVGASFAALANYTSFDDMEPYQVDQVLSKVSPPSDGHYSNKRASKSAGHRFCADVIPANRLNRKDRRADAKFARRNPTIKVA